MSEAAHGSSGSPAAPGTGAHVEHRPGAYLRAASTSSSAATARSNETPDGAAISASALAANRADRVTPRAAAAARDGARPGSPRTPARPPPGRRGVPSRSRASGPVRGGEGGRCQDGRVRSHGPGGRHRRRPASCAACWPSWPRATASRLTRSPSIGNTADDITLFGLRVCPDLDTVMYTLGGGIHEEQGWGRARRDLRRQGGAGGVRRASRSGSGSATATSRPTSSAPRCSTPATRSAQVTEALCARWQPGVRLLPMTDDRVETHVVVDDERAAGGPCTSRSGGCACTPAAPALPIVPVGVEDAKPGARRARGDRRRPTSSCCRRPTRWCSIGTILAVPGHPRRARARPRPRWSACRRSSAARRCAAWPTRCLTAIGVETSRRGGRPAVRRLPRRLAGRRRRDAGTRRVDGGRRPCARTAADDRRRRRPRAIAAAALDLGRRARAVTTVDRASEVLPGRRACREVVAGDDLAALVAAALPRTCATATSWS